MCHIFADSVEAFQAGFGPTPRKSWRHQELHRHRAVMQISEVVVG